MHKSCQACAKSILFPLLRGMKAASENALPDNLTGNQAEDSRRLFELNSERIPRNLLRGSSKYVNAVNVVSILTKVLADGKDGSLLSSLPDSSPVSVTEYPCDA